MGKIRLYHGTITQFNAIDISKGEKFKDFGPGFYLTNRYSHAERVARRKANRANAETRVVQVAYVYKYEFDDKLFNEFRCKYFINRTTNKMSDADWMEWIDFIICNRDTANKYHNYDVVVGPTADDRTTLKIRKYKRGEYGLMGSQDAKIKLKEELKVEELGIQTYIGNQNLADQLNKYRVRDSKGVIIV